MMRFLLILLCEPVFAVVGTTYQVQTSASDPGGTNRQPAETDLRRHFIEVTPQQALVGQPCTLIDRRPTPAILSKCRIVATCQPQATIVAPAMSIASRLLPHAGTDSAIHVHHQRKIAHHSTSSAGAATDLNSIS